MIAGSGPNIGMAIRVTQLLRNPRQIPVSQLWDEVVVLFNMTPTFRERESKLVRVLAGQSETPVTGVIVVNVPSPGHHLFLEHQPLGEILAAGALATIAIHDHPGLMSQGLDLTYVHSILANVVLGDGSETPTKVVEPHLIANISYLWRPRDGEESPEDRPTVTGFRDFTDELPRGDRVTGRHILSGAMGSLVPHYGAGKHWVTVEEDLRRQDTIAHDYEPLVRPG